jgi:hypothetical protein
MFKKMSKREERLKEIEWAYRIRKLNDNRNFLGDSCEDCKKLLVKHQGVKVLIDDFSKVEIKYMKDLCIDCAERECKLYKYNKDNKSSEKCNRALNRAESVKKRVKELLV